MKKLIILLVLLIPVAVWAGFGYIFPGGSQTVASVATSDPCSGGSPGDPGDLLCESFEGSNDPNAGNTDSNWTLEGTGDADCTVSHNQAHSGDGDFDCSTRNIDYIEIDMTDNTTPTECGMSNTATDNIDINVAVSFKVISEGLANTEDVYVFIANGAGGTHFSIRIYDDNGTLKWQLHHQDITSTTNYDLGSTISLGDTWYRHRIKWDGNCGTNNLDSNDCIQWWIAVNDGSMSEQYISDDSTRAGNVENIFIGDVNRTPEGSFNIYVDNVLVDDDDTALDTCN